MDKRLTHLLHQLKGKTYPDSMRKKFYPYAEEALVVMFASIKNGEFRDTQIKNSLNIMFDLTKEACPAKRKELFDIAVECCGHVSPEVRSSASNVVIGLTRMYENYPDLYDVGVKLREDVFPVLKKVLDMGAIGRQQMEYIEDFIAKKF